MEIARDLNASVSAIGLARSALAGTAVAGSLAIGPLIDRVGIRPLIVRGAALAFAGAAATAASPNLAAFYAAHVITGLGVACLLSAGFAGVATYFDEGELPWAMGYVVGMQSLAWILGNPIVGLLAETGSWRLAYLVPAVICLAALVAGLLAPSPQHRMLGEGEPDAIRDGLTAVFRERSARRWTIAEMVAYSAWTAELTYAGAFYVERYGVGETTVGILLAAGSVVFLATSLNTARLTARFPRKPLLVACALGMGVVLVPILNWAPAVLVTLGLFCVMAVFAGIRAAGSGALGLSLLPDRPGAMMGARTASAQLGYTIGAAGGAAVLALWGFGALGVVLFAGMALAAVLLAGVHDPWSDRDGTPAQIQPGPRTLPEPIPD